MTRQELNDAAVLAYRKKRFDDYEDLLEQIDAIDATADYDAAHARREESEERGRDVTLGRNPWLDDDSAQRGLDFAEEALAAEDESRYLEQLETRTSC